MGLGEDVPDPLVKLFVDPGRVEMDCPKETKPLVETATVV